MLLLISHLSATSVVRQPAAASRCAAARLQLSPSEPESAFRAWLESQGPADASLPIVSSGATTAEAWRCYLKRCVTIPSPPARARL